MTPASLRQVQNRFLECLQESGFHKRVPDGMSVPLFDKESPTAIQVARDLYPEYVNHFLSYIEEWSKSAAYKPTGDSGRRATRNRSADQEGLGEA